MTSYQDANSFWGDFGGLHYSFRGLEFDEVKVEVSEGFKDKLLFFGSIESVLIDGVFAVDNWFW